MRVTNKLTQTSYNNKKSTLLILLLVLTLFLHFPFSVSATCTCEAEEDEEAAPNKTEALKYKFIAIATILISGAIGICIPILGQTIPALHPDRNIFFIVKSFAAGIILATGFIHILPDAFNDLTSPCLNENPWGNFPFTGFISMMSAMLTLMADSVATGYYRRSHKLKNNKFMNNNNKGVDNKLGDGVMKETLEDNERGFIEHKQMKNLELEVHTHATHGHAHGSSSSSSKDMLMRHKVISQVSKLCIQILL